MLPRTLKYCTTLILLMCCIGSFGQRLSIFEYFFDKDPGLGNGTAIALNKTTVDTSLSCSVTTLSAGLHTFFIRSYDTSGKWGMYHSGSFIKYDGTDSVLNITGVEYFFDKDPGFGKGKPLTVIPGSDISNNFNIVIPDNGTNSTTFHLRVQDSYGRWSLLFDTTYNLCQVYKTVPNFGFVRYGQQYSLIDSTINNINRKLVWVYDDGSKNDSIINPVHLYSIGRHSVKLIAGSGCRIDSVTKGLFTGIESYSPRNVMGGADYNVDVYGSGFDSSVTATLNDGTSVMKPYNKRIVDASHAVFQFDFHNSLNVKTVKYFDLAINFPNSRYDTVIKKAIEFSPYPDISATPDSNTSIIRPVLEITMNQPGITGSNTWHTGSLTVHYTGWEYLQKTYSGRGLNGLNTVAYSWARQYGPGGPVAKMVPVTFTFDGQLQKIELLGINVINYNSDTIKISQKRFDSIPTVRYVDSLGDIPYKGWVYELVIPEIAPGQTYTINYRYLTPLSLSSELTSYYWKWNTGMIGSKMSDNVVGCVTYLMSSISNLLNLFPPLYVFGAVLGCGSAILQTENTVLSGNAKTLGTMGSAFANIAWGCITAIIPAAELLKKASDVTKLAVAAGQGINNAVNIVPGAQQCISCFDRLSKTTTYNFASADPNEIIGPLGYDTTNRFINSRSSVPYQISFENKPTAARSAQTVRILDTLSNKFDLSTFQLTGFAIGDSIFKIPPFRKEYTTTIDLTKKQKVFVRFNASLDSASRIAKWTFTSLDPTTKQVLTDTTLAGFLPPDSDGIVGNANVSFVVLQDTANNKNLDRILNRAAIIFDNNQEILTNTWKNVLDKTLPTGKIDSVRLVSDTSFRVYYSSNDAESGIGSHKLYTAKDSGAFVALTLSPAKSVLISGNKDSSYNLMMIPQDNVGNLLVKNSPEISFILYNLAPITGDSLICIDITKAYKVSDTTKGGSWKSSDATIATIDSLGNIKGLKAGKAVISYTVNRNNLIGTVTRNIVVKPIVAKPSITWSGSEFSTSATGVSYQWLLNNSPISGATSATYKPVIIGSYRIQVSTDSAACKNVSDSFLLVVTAVGTYNTPAGHIAKILPNPASNQVTIQFGQTPNTNLTMQLINAEGKIVKTISSRSQLTNIALANISSGYYFIKIIGKDYDQTQQLLISK